MRRAFSLMEMLVLLGLLGMMLGLVTVNLGGRTHAANTRAVAELLADHLRLARAMAISQGRPCALAIPGGCSQTCYRLEGENTPKITQIIHLSGGSVFWGHYPGPTWSAAPLNPGYPFSLTTWNPPHPEDALLVFLPDGSLVTNRQQTGNAYRLVAASAVEITAGVLQHAADAITVQISLAGQVSIVPGIPEAGPGVQGPPGNAFNPFPAPPRGAGPNRNPQFVAPYLEVSPKPQLSTLPVAAPPRSNATVASDGTVSLTTLATDPDGDPLFCRWEGKGPQGEGMFSCPGGARMRWDGKNQLWTSTWTWHPPKNAVPGDQYELNCTVVDDRGGSTTPAEVGVDTVRVAVVARGYLAYSSNVLNLGPQAKSLFRCNWDGTDPFCLAPPDFSTPSAIFCIQWSPDGSKVSFIQNNNIMLVNWDGTGLTRLATLTGPTVIWDRAGRGLYVMYQQGASRSIDLFSLDAGAPQRQNLASGLIFPIGVADVSVHPAGSPFLVMGGNSNTSFWVWPAEGGQPQKIVPFPNVGAVPMLSPSGQKVVGQNGPGGLLLHLVNRNAATRAMDLISTTNLYPGQFFESPKFSPDELWITGQAQAYPNNQLCIARADGSKFLPLILPGSENDTSDWGIR